MIISDYISTIHEIQGIVMFVQIPSVLNEMIHFKVLSPVYIVLLVVSDRPVVEHALLEDEANENLREILNRLARKTQLRVHFCKELS
jgi:hypothetical protein